MRSIRTLSAALALSLFVTGQVAMAADSPQVDELTGLKIEIEKLRRNLVTPQTVDESAANAVERRDSAIRAQTEARLKAFEETVRQMVEAGVAKRLAEFQTTAEATAQKQAAILERQEALKKTTEAAVARADALSRENFSIKTAADALASRVTGLEGLKLAERLAGLKTDVGALQGKQATDSERLRLVEDKAIPGLNTRLAALTAKQQTDSEAAWGRLGAVEKRQQAISDLETAVSQRAKTEDVGALASRVTELANATVGGAGSEMTSKALADVTARLGAIEKKEGESRVATVSPAELSALNERVSAVEKKPAAPVVEIGSLEKRIAVIEGKVNSPKAVESSEAVKKQVAEALAEVQELRAEIEKRSVADTASARAAASKAVDEKLVIFANEMGAQLAPVRAQAEQASKDAKSLREDNYGVLADQVRALISRLETVERTIRGR